MSRSDYVIKKGDNYYFRRRVPKSVADAIGKVEWIIPLKTQDRKIAHQRALILEDQTNQEIARALRIKEGKPLSGDEISRMGETHFTETNAYLDSLSSRISGDDAAILRRASAPGPGPTNLDDFIAWANSEASDTLLDPDPVMMQRASRDRLAVLLVHLKHGDFSPIQTFADHEFERLGLVGSRVDNDGCETLDIDRTRPDYQALARELMEKEIASLKRRLVQLVKAEVGHVDAPQTIMAPPATTGATPTELHPDATKTPIELFPKFAAYCRDSKLGESTIRNYETAIMRLQEVTKKKPIALITMNDVTDCVDLISKAPAKFKTMLKAQTMRESIVANDDRAEKGEKIVSITKPATINKHISALRTFFGWAEQRNSIAANPTAKVKGPKKGRALPEHDEDNPDPYTLEELNKIFRMKEFTEPNEDMPYRYWVPLCSLYTGSRMGEICRLDVNDIKQDGEYYWFVITATKTKKRYAVPIHDELKRLGFLEYVAIRRKAGGKLFPDAPLGATGRSNYAPVTQWWDHVTTREGIKRPGRNIHRFRYSFITARVSCGIPDSIGQALVGHASGSTKVERGYVDIALVDVIDLWERGISKLSFRGLDLSHLYPKR